jgi:hypothetical protein
VLALEGGTGCGEVDLVREFQPRLRPDQREAAALRCAAAQKAR